MPTGWVDTLPALLLVLPKHRVIAMPTRTLASSEAELDDVLRFSSHNAGIVAQGSRGWQ